MPYTRCHIPKIVTGLVQRIHRAMADPAGHAVLLDVGPPVLLERVMDQVADPDGDHRARRSARPPPPAPPPRRPAPPRPPRRAPPQRPRPPGRLAGHQGAGIGRD